VTRNQREILYEKIDASLDEARRYMPDATDAEVREWVTHMLGSAQLSRTRF
jgi:hypothetical protein